MKRIISALISAVIAVSAVPFVTFAAGTPAVASEKSAEPEFYLENINFDDFTAEIGEVANCTGDLVIPSKVNRFSIVGIQAKTFFGNTEITSVTIPESVKYIGENAFTGCLSLESVTISNSVTELGKGCFTSCTALKSVSLGKGVTTIPENCFYACTSLRSIEFPENITEIGDQAFFGCGDLSGAYIPPTVTAIGKDAIGRHYSIRNGRTENISGFTLSYDSDSAAAEYAESHGIERAPFKGDVNLDNKITAADASLVLQEYASLSGGNKLSFTEKQFSAADMNSDGKLDARDAAKILQKYAELQ